MKKRVEKILVLGCAVLLVVTGYASGGDMPKAVTLLTGPPAGTMEVVGAAAAELWKNNIPGVEFSSVPTGGTSVNVNLMDQGDGEVCIITGDGVASAMAGEAPYKKKYTEIRSMFAIYPNTLQIWTLKDKGINDYSDLQTKKWTYGQPGGGPYQPAINMMGIYGFSPDVVKQKGGRILPYAWGEAVNNLADGNIDAVLWTTTFPAGKVVDAELTREFQLLQLPQDKLDAYKAKYKGWVDVVVPANTYRSQPKDVKTIGTPSMFACQASLPDDLVYQMTKTLWNNLNVLGNTHALLKGITKDNVARGMVAPLHPGAKKFYVEAGIPFDE